MVEAVGAAVVVRFVAVEIVLPGGAIRLLDGASQVTFNVDHGEGAEALTFVGEDETYGRLGKVEAVTEGYGSQAPRLRFTILPPTLAAAATLCAPTVQESEVNLWWGVCDLSTGDVLDDPELLFTGALDVPKYTRAAKVRGVEFDCMSAFESMFAVEEGQRLVDEFMRKIDPDADGLIFVTEVERSLPWGSETPRPHSVAGRGGDGSPGSNQLENPAKAVLRTVFRGW